MKVAVLGCGPAGLVIADKLSEHPNVKSVDIFSRPQKSVISGAQYMHANIGWFCGGPPDLEVEIIKSGSGRGYAHNVYNDFDAKTSWVRFRPGTMFGWDMKLAYNQLWNVYGGDVIDLDVTAGVIREMLGRYDKVFSTIPLRSICTQPHHHSFYAQKVAIIHGDGSSDLIKGVNDGDIMYYNGVPPELGGFRWYRFSQLNKYQSWEYAEHYWDGELQQLQPWHRVTVLEKPLMTNCDCYPGLIRMGRYGAWDKNVLTHQLPEKVEHAMQQV